MIRNLYIVSHFQRHVFFCTNQRANGESCCNALGASELRQYAKTRVKELAGQTPSGALCHTRINSAGCLGRCELGPVMVVYPDAVWYTYIDQDDIDEIIDQHLVLGKIVERLQV